MIKEERKRKRKRKKRIIILVVIAAVVAALVFFALVVCTVKEVDVEGNVLYDDDTVISTVLDNEYCKNTLYVWLRSKFLGNPEMPFIDDVEISIKLPHTVHITVYEKGTLGFVSVSSMGQNAYFDKDGMVVEMSDSVIDDVPEIVGLDIGEVVLYEKLPIEDATLRVLLNLTRALDKYELYPESIDISDTDNVLLKFKNIKVEFGDDGYLNEKVQRMTYILPELKKKKGTLHIDMWSPDTTDIVFSEKSS